MCIAKVDQGTEPFPQLVDFQHVDQKFVAVLLDKGVRLFGLGLSHQGIVVKNENVF